MGSKTSAPCILFLFLAVLAAPGAYASGYCNQPPPVRQLSPPISTGPALGKMPPKHTIPHPRPPVVVNPPVVNPPYGGGSTPATNTPPSMPGKCSMDVLKLGLCLDVLGLVHLGIRPIENFCCPVLQGLLEVEAAVCLCTAIRLRVLNLNIYIPLALSVLVACGKEPPPGYLCPAL